MKVLKKLKIISRLKTNIENIDHFRFNRRFFYLRVIHNHSAKCVITLKPSLRAINKAF